LKTDDSKVDESEKIVLEKEKKEMQAPSKRSCWYICKEEETNNNEQRNSVRAVREEEKKEIDEESNEDDNEEDEDKQDEDEEDKEGDEKVKQKKEEAKNKGNPIFYIFSPFLSQSYKRIEGRTEINLKRKTKIYISKD
jgi:predicted ATP-dependent protease